MAAAARVDGGWTPFPLVDRPGRPHVISAQEAVEGAINGAVSDAVVEAQDWEAAQREVNRAMKRGGRDPLAVQATDAQATRAIAELLGRVRRTKENATDDALRVALERGDAVARALGAL